MSFGVFLALLLSPLTFGVLTISMWLYRQDKKETGFKTSIIYLTLIGIWLVFEGYNYVSVNRNGVLNPSYTWSNQMTTASDNGLPYMHRPNMNWNGLSHGDLAVLNADSDPYARKVQFKTDSQGFRNHREYGQAQIVVVGDLFTEAGNVNEEDTYCAQLAKLLGLDVKNLAVSGYTTPEELVVFSQFGLAMQPKTVILQVAESNDIAENIKYYDWVKASKPTRNLSKVDLRTKDAWKLASPTFRLYQKLFPMRLNDWDLQGMFKDGSGHTWLMRFAHPPTKTAVTKNELVGWNVMKGSILRFNEICQERGIRLVVMLVPDKINVLGKHVTLHSQNLKKIEELPLELTLGYLLQQYCADLGVYYINMKPELAQATEQGKLVYLPMDTHLSPEGHEVVATEMARFLTSPK